MTSRPIQNLTWDRNSSRQDIQSATKEITKAVADVGKDTKKIVDTVKAGSDKVVDAIGRIKSTTNAEQTAAPKSKASAVATGLTSIAESASKMAQHLCTHPDEGKTIVDGMERINRQLTDLTVCAREAADNNEKLREVVSESKSTADHILGNFNVPSSCGCYVGNGAFAALLRQRYGE